MYHGTYPIATGNPELRSLPLKYRSAQVTEPGTPAGTKAATRPKNAAQSASRGDNEGHESAPGRGGRKAPVQPVWLAGQKLRVPLCYFAELKLVHGYASIS